MRGQFSSDHLLRRVQLFATPWTAACQASLSITNSWSSPKPGLLKWVSSLHQVAKVLQFQLQYQSFQCHRREEGLMLREQGGSGQAEALLLLFCS